MRRVLGMHLIQRRSSFDLKAALLTGLWGGNISYHRTASADIWLQWGRGQIIKGISTETHYLCNMGHPPKLNCCKVSFTYNLFRRCPIPLKCCTEHGSVTAYLYNISKWLNNWNGRYERTRFRDMWCLRWLSDGYAILHSILTILQLTHWNKNVVVWTFFISYCVNFAEPPYIVLRYLSLTWSYF